MHNGIIENYRALRAELEAEAPVFETETDTEAVAQLCDRELAARQAPRVEAARATLARLERRLRPLLPLRRRGRPADRRPPRLAARHRLRRRRDLRRLRRARARAAHPAASPTSRRATSPSSPAPRSKIFDAAGVPVRRARHQLAAGERLRREGPLQALHGQGDARAADRARRRARALPHPRPQRRGRRRPASTSPRCDRLVLVACGTAHYACHVARYWFETLRPAAGRDRGRLRVPLPRAAARRPAPSASSSASRARPPTPSPRCATSGTQGRPDRRGRQRRDLDHRPREPTSALPILAGPEIGVASTKAFTCQLAVLALPRHRRRPPARHPRRRRGGAPGRGARHRARPRRAGAGPRAADRRDRPRARRAPRTCSSSAAAPMYPAGARRRAEAEGNQLHPRRRLRIGRAQARPHRAGRRGRAGDRARPVGRALRQDRLEHAGGDGPRRQGAPPQRRRRHRPRRPGRLAHAGDARRPTPSSRRSSMPPRRSSSPTTPPS